MSSSIQEIEIPKHIIKKLKDITGKEISVTNDYIKGNDLTSGIICNIWTGVDFDKSYLARWWFSTFPGNCGIIVSMYGTVYHPYLRKGIGTLLNKIRIYQAKQMDYSLLMCTDRHHNSPSIKILDKNKWTKAAKFVNLNTDNLCDIYCIDLRQSYSELGIEEIKG